jgi:hypothetical protein
MVVLDTEAVGPAPIGAILDGFIEMGYQPIATRELSKLDCASSIIVALSLV